MFGNVNYLLFYLEVVREWGFDKWDFDTGAAAILNHRTFV